MDRGGVYYYIYDGLGSTRQLVNTSGGITDTWGYSAFGELASHTGTTTNPFLFNAQQFDGASGDYYLRARYYDQSNGRFVSQDPFGGYDDDPISLHRYLYAGDDPIDRSDPSGRDPNFSLAGLSASIASIGSFIATRATIIHLGGSIILGLVNPDLADDLAKAEQAIPVFGAEDSIGASTGRAIRRASDDLLLETLADSNVVVRDIANSTEPQLRSLASNLRRAIVGQDPDWKHYLVGNGNVSFGSFSADGQGLIGIAKSNRNFPGTVAESLNPLLSPTKYGSGHAERRILEDVFDRYKNNPNIDGDLLLYSERTFCPNCIKSIADFKLRMPNVRVHLVTSGKDVEGAIELVP